MHFFGIPPSARPSDGAAKIAAQTNVDSTVIIILNFADTLPLISNILSPPHNSNGLVILSNPYFLSKGKS